MFADSRSSKSSNGEVCAIYWVDGRDNWRLRRWLPHHMLVKDDVVWDKVRNIRHRLVPNCVVVVFKDGKVEIA